MVAFLSAGLGLGHKDFDGYRAFGFCGLKGPECQ